MSTVNITKSNTDSTVRIFDNFYKKEIVVNANEFDVVKSFFLKNITDPTVADDFTSAFFKIQQNYNVTTEELLKRFEGLDDPLAIDETIAYYLNGLRSKSTLLGVSVIQQPNLYAARNVIK